MTKVTIPEIKPGQGPDDILTAIGNGFEGAAITMFSNYTVEIQAKRKDAGDAIADSTARRIAQENVGYESVKYSFAIGERAEILLGAYHPVFGKVADRKPLTDAHCLKSGYFLGRLMKAGYKLEETALYYPRRKGLYSLEDLLEKPHLDSILGPVSLETDAEQKQTEEKTDAFFNSLGSSVPNDND